MYISCPTFCLTEIIWFSPAAIIGPTICCTGELTRLCHLTILEMATNMVDKSEMESSTGPVEDHLENDKSSDSKRGNAEDRADMYRMGKIQELRVRYVPA